jgi:hypothetical protein
MTPVHSCGFDVRWVRPLNAIRQNDCMRPHLQVTSLANTDACNAQWQARASDAQTHGVVYDTGYSARPRMGRFPYVLRTTRTCDRSALATRVELPRADRASGTRFDFVSHGTRRRARDNARQAHAACERHPRALLDPSGRTVLAGVWFTWNCPRFAPATRISQIGHFDPPAGVAPPLRQNRGRPGVVVQPIDWAHD